MESVIKDLRFAFRSLFKRPGFVAVAVITLVLALVSVVVACPVSVVVTEGAESVPTSVVKWTVTPLSGSPLTFWTFAVIVARPASAPVPIVAPSLRLKGAELGIGGVGDGVSGL